MGYLIAMIISYLHNFIFIKSRKTAGSSILKTLQNTCGPDDFCNYTKQTRTWTEHKKAFSAITKKRLLYRLWLKISGQYGWHSSNANHPPAWLVKAFLRDQWNTFFKFAFVRNPWDLTVSRFHWDRFMNRHCFDDFGLWVRQRNTWHWDILHQYTHINGKPALDFVGRYETLENDFAYVCEKTGLEKLTLKDEKSSAKETGPIRNITLRKPGNLSKGSSGRTSRISGMCSGRTDPVQRSFS